jgi:hypothetical protein
MTSIVSETEYYYQDGFYAPSCDDTNTLQSDSSTKSGKIKEKQTRSYAHVFQVKSKITLMPIKVRAFETLQVIGAPLRNAITGLPCRNRDNKCCKYGSSDEYDYFKIRDISNLKKGGLVFFYDSPDQYERHFQKSLPENVTKSWNGDA